MCVCVFFLRIIKNSKKNVNVTIRGKLYDVGFGSDFFDMTPRAQDRNRSKTHKLCTC